MNSNTNIKLCITLASFKIILSLSFPSAKKLLCDGFCRNSSTLILLLGVGDIKLIDKLFNIEGWSLGAAKATVGFTIGAIGVDVGVITGASGYSSSLASDSINIRHPL